MAARRLTLDNRALRRELSHGGHIMDKLIGSSPAMERLREDILDLGQADGHVLIDGETGTGKTLVAHALHAVGARLGRKFVLVACGALDEDALTRRLFGPVMPDESRLPAIEEARGGTLVLEGVETLSMRSRSACWASSTTRARRPRRASSRSPTCRTRAAPARMRCAPTCSIASRRCASRCRRCAARRGHPDPVHRFAEQFSEEYGCDAPTVSAQEAAQLLQAPWPGNVRQLINVAERAVLQSRRGQGTIASLLMSDNDEMRRS